MTYLTTVWNYRHFWMSLVHMDLRTRYRRSVLGLGWSLLQPLAMTSVLYVVFQHFMDIDASQYVPHLLSGTVCWSYFVACTVQGCQCFFLGEAYIRQCPLPLAIYPLRTVIGAMFHFAMGLVVVTGLTAIFRGMPPPSALLSLFPTILVLFVLGWAMAVIGGSANVFFQDTQHLTEVAFQIFFYLTPIIYPIELVAKHQYGWLLQWNPAVPFMELVRQPLLHGLPPTPVAFLHASAIAGGLAVVATVLLGKLQKSLIFFL